MAITMEELQKMYPEEEDLFPEEMPPVKWLKTDEEIRAALTEEDVLPGNDPAHPASSLPEYEAVCNEGSNRYQLRLAVRLLKRHQQLSLFGDAMESAEKQPPKFGEYLAYLFLPKTDRVTLLGDLTEEYPKLVKKFGLRWAKVYFYKQVLWSILPLIRKTVIKWGLFGWLVELIRKIGS